MKIVIVNGSPRKGNTEAAINALMEGAGAKHEFEIIEPDKVNISPCKGCGACNCRNGCVAKDDSTAVIDRLVAADMIVFATPVYWWGMTAQLKTVIDKCYCRAYLLKDKKIGTIVVGGSPTAHEQYELIRRQFACMADYLNWNMCFEKSYYAYGKHDLENDTEAIAELRAIGASL